MKLKDACSLKEKLLKKQRHYFTNRRLSSWSYGFSSSHVWMWELDYKGSWVQKNWCFWTVVLEKTLEIPLDCKDIQPVHPKVYQSWVFIRTTDIETETPIFLATWCEELTHLRKPWCWERLRAGGEGDNRGWDGWMSLSTQWMWGDSEGQGSLACYSPWSCKELDTT